MAIDWARAYSAHWRVFRVNPATWTDGEIVDGVESVDVSRDTSGKAPELESGTITASLPVLTEFEPGYYRVAMTAEQSGSIERVDIATLLCESTGGTINHGLDTSGITGRSVLHPAAVTSVQPGEHVPAGGDGAQHAARLLRQCLAAPVEVDGSFTLDDAFDFALGDTCLEAAWEVLNAGGFVIQIDGGGRVAIRPKPAEPALTLDRANARLLMPGIQYALDWSKVPNRVTVTDGGETARAENLTGSPASYDQRGHWVDKTEDSPVRVNGETLAACAARLLEEASTITDSRTYTREWWPGVLPFSIVRGSMADVKLDGDMRVASQSVSCGMGVTVTEKACREVSAWTA